MRFSHPYEQSIVIFFRRQWKLPEGNVIKIPVCSTNVDCLSPTPRRDPILDSHNYRMAYKATVPPEDP